MDSRRCRSCLRPPSPALLRQILPPAAHDLCQEVTGTPAGPRFAGKAAVSQTVGLVSRGRISAEMDRLWIDSQA